MAGDRHEDRDEAGRQAIEGRSVCSGAEDEDDICLQQGVIEADAMWMR